jgi:hypothetical protein
MYKFIWQGKRKIITISITAILVLATTFFIFAWPNLKVSAISISISEWQARSIRYDPSGDHVAVIKIGDKVGYSITTSPSSTFILTRCEYDSTIIELSRSNIIAKQPGITDIICRSTFKKDITSKFTIEVTE